MSQKNNTRYRFALTIAGSDSGGGAGIQADLKAFAAVGAFGLSAITALTAQNTRGVNAIYPSGAQAVTAQLNALISDFPIDAIKTGMLFDASTIAAVTHSLAALQAPLVVDPVMIATSGAKLLDQNAVGAYRPLIARATLLTPNLPEAQALLNCAAINTRDEMLSAANRLLEFGCQAVLLKGGHAPVGTKCLGESERSNQISDLLLIQTPTGPTARWFTTERLDIRGHGTGCTLAALITAFLARGLALESATAKAILMLRKALGQAQCIGAGHVQTPDPFFRAYRLTGPRADKFSGDSIVKANNMQNDSLNACQLDADAAMIQKS